MSAGRAMRVWGAAALAALLAAPGALAAPPGKAAAPGAYCAIPEPGETPDCLDPAKSKYGDFFRAVEAGETGDAPLAEVERAVASGAGDADAYLALSSLAYGYYQLSQRAAREEGADPAIARRLERWNELFASVYGEDPEATAWRSAVREAARDLEARAAPVPLECRSRDGVPQPCSATEAVLWNLDQTAADVGYRGGLEKLLERWFGGGAS